MLSMVFINVMVVGGLTRCWTVEWYISDPALGGIMAVDNWLGDGWWNSL
jgi:hypothetical protein